VWRGGLGGCCCVGLVRKWEWDCVLEGWYIEARCINRVRAWMASTFSDGEMHGR
jgi:hypothetical protein